MGTKKTKTKTKAKKSTKAKRASVERGSNTGKDGQSKAEFWQGIFSKNSKAKLTDEKLVALFNKNFANETDEKCVSTLRSLYNAGRLSGQEKKPKTLCAKFDKKGEVVKRGRKPGSTVAVGKKPKAKLTIKKVKLVIKKKSA